MCKQNPPCNHDHHHNKMLSKWSLHSIYQRTFKIMVYGKTKHNFTSPNPATFLNDKLKKDSVIDIYPMEIVSVYEPQNQNNSYYFDLDQIDYQGDVSYNSYKKCKKYHRDCLAMFANEPDPNQNEIKTKFVTLGL